MSQALSYADLARPTARRSALAYDLGLIALGSALVAIAATVSVRLPFTPVPWTMQPLAVLLVGALLGSRRGAAAMLAYLAEGLSGLPVFADGSFGPGPLMGPTGGYLVGFVAAAWVVGALAERGWDRHFLSTWAAMALGSLTLFAFGLPWLAQFTGWNAVLAAGLWPFVPGDLLKQVLAALLLPGAWKLAQRAGWMRG